MRTCANGLGLPAAVDRRDVVHAYARGKTCIRMTVAIASLEVKSIFRRPRTQQFRMERSLTPNLSKLEGRKPDTA